MINADHSMRPKFGISNVCTENRTILCLSPFSSQYKYSSAGSEGETVFNAFQTM